MGGVCMKRRKIIAILIAFALVIALLPSYTSRAEDVQDEVVESSPSDADEEIVDESSESLDLEIQETPIRVMKLLRPSAILLGDSPDSSGYTLIFTVQAGTRHTIAKDGERLSIDGGIVELHDANNTEIPTTITVDSDSSATMEVPAGKTGKLNYGGNNFTLYANGQPFSIDTEITGAMSFAVQDYENNSGPGPDPGAEGDSEAIIRLTGPDGNWKVKPMVTEDYDIVSDEGCSAPYNRYCYTTKVSINGGQRTEGLNQYNKNADVSRYGKQYVRFDYNEEDAGKVTLNFSHNWADKITYLKINDEEFTNQLPDYSDKATWLSYFKDQGVSFDIEVPLPMPLPEEEKDNPEDPDPYMEEGRPVFNIEIMSEPITEEECYIGNFGWSKDDYFSPEGENPSDLYIGHCSLILVSAQLDLGNGETEMWDLGGIEDTGAEVKNDLYPYAHFQMNRPSRMASEDEIPCSEMVIPTDSWVTMKIVPEPGYQVKSFEINGNSVKVGAEASVFSFKVSKGNFHIGAHVEQQTNDSKVDSKVVKGAALLEISDEDLDAGTARLYVSDSDLTEEKQAEFEAEAAKEGLTIENIVDISAAQVFFKGTGNPDDVWANPKEDLEEPALLGIQLEGDYTGKDVEFVHNIHDGEAFETIEPVEFDRANNIVYFEVDSFSSYAIATKPITAETPKDETKEATKEATVTPAKKAEVKSTKPATADNFNIMLIGAIAIVSAAGIVFVVRRKRMIGK